MKRSEFVSRLEAEAAKELAQRFATTSTPNSTTPSLKAVTPKTDSPKTTSSKTSPKTKSKKPTPLDDDFDVIEHEEAEEDEEVESPSAKFRRSEAIREDDESATKKDEGLVSNLLVAGHYHSL